MSNKIIFFSFAILLFLTPLFWTPWNFELFEYNKMIITYFLTIVITGTWVWKMVAEKTFIFKITPLHIPLGLFLIANILSTIFSTDLHTSIWGYYSRSNGGLLSTISYLLLFCAFVSNITKEQAVKLLKIALAGSAIVALWAIPEHFGVSPSCVILRGEFNADCWIQNVQARVFASLGQPNWLAAYMGMLIFPALYFFLTATTQRSRITYYLLLITYYMAFTFTYSRGGMLGVVTGLGLFSLIIFLQYLIGKNFTLVKGFGLILVTFLAINIIYGSAFTRFNLSQLISPSKNITQSSKIQLQSTTQLDNGGNESGQIRLIVWQGALDIFKHYPVFGSGVETFAYSYYKFRPTSHNLVSEWDFLYNKAHNEFLNYLATTGIIGFGTYILVIGTFLVSGIKYIVYRFKQNTLYSILYTSLLASYIAYLVQNIFGFSVVMIALLFYLLPAFAFVLTDSAKPILSLFPFPPALPAGRLFSFIYSRSIYTKVTKGIVIFSTFYLLLSIFQLWYADTLFALGEKASEVGNAGRSYNYLADAVSLNPGEPFYRSELGYAAASAALALKDEDSTLSAEIKERALLETTIALTTSPNNVSFWRTAIRTYYQLAPIDPGYTQKTLEVIDKTISLAPTDPKLYYNKAIILGQIDKNKEAIEALKKAIELKPNYRESYYALALFYYDLSSQKQTPPNPAKQKEYGQKAVEVMNQVLKLIPGDPEALKQLENWGKLGIATTSGKAR